MNNFVLIIFLLHAALFYITVATSNCPADSKFKTNVLCENYTVFQEDGGFLQEVTADSFPVLEGSISIAYVKINPYCLRQLHWHRDYELAYVIRGSARVGVVGPGGNNSSFFDVNKGDSWFFPQGFLQYFQAGHEGIEVVLWFNKDHIGTLTVPQSLEHVPLSQIQDSFFITNDNFFHKWSLHGDSTICPTELTSWTIGADDSCNATSPYKFHVDCANNAGTVRDAFGNKILDVTTETFPILAQSTISFTYAVIKPQCQRVLHWHPLQVELAFVVQGSANIGVFGFPDGKSKEPDVSLFSVSAGDIWFFPVGYLQYITNNAAEGGEDVIAILGFSENNLQTFTSAGSLKPIPEGIQKLSLGLHGNAFELVSETEEPFSCLGVE